MPKTKRSSNKRVSRPIVRTAKSSLEEKLALYFEKKAPPLPKGVKEFLVAVAPWAVLLVTVLSVPAFLGLVGLSAVMPAVRYGWGMMGSGFGMMGRSGFFFVESAFLVAKIVLYVLALPGLFKRLNSGWKYMYYATLLNVVKDVLNLDFIGLVIGSLIALYVLFQVRSYYKK